MRYIALQIILLINITFGFSQSPTVKRPIVGRIYSNIQELSSFRGYKLQRSALLQPTKENYGVSIIAKGHSQIMLLDSCIRIGNGIQYIVLDTIHIAFDRSLQDIVISDCRIKKQIDHDIIAIVRNGDQQYTSKIIKAWKINRSRRRIERIRVNDIDCLYEDYGL